LELYIPISYLNDFLFCPRSIYFHQLYANFNSTVYHQAPQSKGKAAHETIDTKKYSTKSSILQGVEVYSEKYSLFGKIDIFDVNSGKLRERKREIKRVYEGYVMQIYAQCICLREMGFHVSSLSLYDMTHNRETNVALPEDDPEMMSRFEQVVDLLFTFDLFNTSFTPFEAKCKACIYSNLCDFSLC
jgi:CRISPR-associated exonuclease Cas4